MNQKIKETPKERRARYYKNRKAKYQFLGVCQKCGAGKSSVGILCRQCWKESIAVKPKKCSISSCSNMSAIAGLCNSHYLRLRRFGTTDPRPRKQRERVSKWTGMTCLVAGCTKRIESSGYCNRHYHRLLRYGNPIHNPRDVGRIPCVQPNCPETTVSAHGFCKRHRRKVYAAKEYGSKQRIARLAAWYAEKKGLLIRPRECVVCGSNNRIEAHHADYDKPLYVIYLCKKCHSAVHSSKKFVLDPALFAKLLHH